MDRYTPSPNHLRTGFLATSRLPPEIETGTNYAESSIWLGQIWHRLDRIDCPAMQAFTWNSRGAVHA